MIKPESLRAALVAAVPHLRRNPDRLLIFADEGSVAATFAPGLSFEWRYTLNLIVTDFAGHPDAIMVPLLAWVRDNQPELLANPARQGDITFEADIIDSDKLDLSIKLKLTERVGVHARADGSGVDVEHYHEPSPEPALGIPTGGAWAVTANGESITEWDDPRG